MPFFPRLRSLVRPGLLAGAVLLSTSSCETTRTGSRERSLPSHDYSGRAAAASATAALAGSAASRLIVQVGEAGKVTYKTSQPTLSTALMRQLGDGTTIDRIMVRQAPVDDPKDKAGAPYYLIGMGQKEGNFRAIALPLRGSDDGTYYLTPNADRYVLTGTACPTCFFDFEDGHIIGATCGDGSAGGNCQLKILPSNQVFVHQ
ncbi:MAG: hypothetical protein ACRYFK_14965 [Janthinobacterium lividum]